MKSDKILVDNIELDLTNHTFFNAAKLVLDSDIDVMYLTGKAGTGKSIFVKYIQQIYKGNLITLAPTGVAAINVKGQTIHSFFSLGLSVYSPNDDRLSNKKIQANLKLKNDKQELIKKLDLIIIDEISMVRCDILDAIDIILKYYRKKKSPFGGVKMLLVGDVFQLPPVITYQEKQIVNKFYKSEYFFSSNIYQNSSPLYIELDKVYRQQEALFLSILEKVRINDVTDADLEILNENSARKNLSESIVLSSKKAPAENYNTVMLEKIDEEEITLMAQTTGSFPDSLKPVDTCLKLKIGAQVMIMKNRYDQSSEMFVYYNGQIGTISSINAGHIEVKYKDSYIYIEQAKWDNNKYVWDEKRKMCITEELGTFTQYPLKLAWAITIHKSQGLTFDNINIDLSDWVANGGMYVALSRCRKLSGIHLKNPLRKQDIKIDNNVMSFAESKTPDTLILSKIEDSKVSQLYSECRSFFDDNDSEGLLAKYKKAAEIRDVTDTQIFHKYIRVKLSMYHRYRAALSAMLLKYGSIKEELSESQKIHFLLSEEYLANKLESGKLTSQIEILTNEQNQYLSHIIELKDSMYELKDHLSELKTTKINLIHDCTDKDREIAELKFAIQKNELQIKDLKKDNGNLNSNIISTNQELQRVNNITWFQKLIGKK